ncbi:MAG: hypothetical protein JST70_05400 [Bacteroidetes bacterium]|nr:hypothetical protein [Bacteroidota bacterium]
MVKIKSLFALGIFTSLFLLSCVNKHSGNNRFDELNSTQQINHWKFVLNVEDQNKKQAVAVDKHYLKATLYISNVKAGKSLLYSLSDDVADYETKYKYLSFGCEQNLYIKCKDEYVYPIGYVFEPSNGLSTSERLVYKFQIDNKTYDKLMQASNATEYWYVDKLIGLGKICFK